MWALGAAAIACVPILLLNTPRTEWALLPLTALGAEIASSIAALAALAVSEIVSQRRKAELDMAVRTHRERVYEQLLLHMTGMFTNGKPTEEAKTRASIAVWGGSEIETRFAAWRAASHGIMRSSGGTVPLPEQAELQGQLAEMALSVRQDRMNLSKSTDSATAPQIADMIVDDYTEALKFAKTYQALEELRKES